MREKMKIEAPSDKWTKGELLTYIEQQQRILNNREARLADTIARNDYDTTVKELKAELFGIKQSTQWVLKVLEALADIKSGRDGKCD